MAEMWFDPDAIRGDIESEITNCFYPSPFSATVNYAINDLVRLNGVVYSATTPVIGSIPPAAPWDPVGNVLPVIYENVSSTTGVKGALQTQISWLATNNQSIGSGEGALRSINGVLSCWIYSPRNTGTSAALKDAMRLRKLLSEWRRVSDCGKQIRIYSINGPRAVTPRPGDDFYLHTVTASLVAMERVQTLR